VNRRRRAALLLGLALVLGALAASDVARREAAIRDQLGPLVDVVVAQRPLAAGRRVAAADLAVRRVPERFAPSGGPPLPELLLGQELAVPVPAGGQVTEHQLARASPAPGPGVRRGERAVEVVASASHELVTAGARVDVLVTQERGAGGPGTTALALEDVEVLAARPAPARDAGGRQVEATLRVTVRQAIYLAAAGAFAHEIRLLSRPPGDRRRTGPAALGSDLRPVVTPP
jgi:pilus assembly protein CpaB